MGPGAAVGGSRRGPELDVSSGFSTHHSIQSGAISPSCLSAPPSTRGLQTGDKQAWPAPQQQQQQWPRGGEISGGMGCEAQPVECDSPPVVSRSGSWINMSSLVSMEASGAGAGSILGQGRQAVVQRPSSAMAGALARIDSSGNGLSSSMSIEADRHKR